MNLLTKTQLDRLNLYCDSAKEGLVVLEINEVVNRQRLLQLFIRNGISYIDVSLSSNYFETMSVTEGDILVLYNFEVKYTTLEIVRGLNLRRELFMSLHKIIVLVLNTYTVNNLISEAYSFWSYVQLHETISLPPKLLLDPIYLRDPNISPLSFDTSPTLNAIAEDFHNALEAGTALSIINTVNFWSAQSQMSENLFLKLLISVANYLTSINQANVTRLYDYIIQRTDPNKNPKYISLWIDANLGAGYSCKDIPSAIAYLEKLVYNAELLSTEDMITIYNNTAVVFYKAGYFTDAERFYCACLDNTENMSIEYQQVLKYNLALNSYATEDFSNAITYMSEMVNTPNQYICKDVSHLINIGYNLIQLAQGYPSEVHYLSIEGLTKHNLIVGCIMLLEISLILGDKLKAFSYASFALDNRKYISTLSPEHKAYAHQLIGYAFLYSGHKSEAVARLRLALSLYGKLDIKDNYNINEITCILSELTV